jgi:DNA-binding winged helix-turn-helix (wHTH) protein/tetratricopeptide (TPR) repeat protein
VHGSKSPLRDPSCLASRADFHLGPLAVRPATRALEGPATTVLIEPRVMEVLLALADAGGAVVTRDALLDRCWRGVFVGEDALNRAISELRRALRTVGSSVQIETIPRTGYRLVGLPECDDVFTSEAAIEPGIVRSRRWLLGGLAGVAAAGGTVLVWRGNGPSPEERAAARWVERGDIARRNDMPDADEQGVGFYREAVKLAPHDAATWGKLALSLAGMAEYAEPAEVARAVQATELAARRAIERDARQPDARVALAMLTPHFGAWRRFEQAMRAVLADAPGNVAAQSNLALVLIEVGRVAESAAIIDRLVAREPLSPAFQYRHVYLLWARGDMRGADRVADQSLQLWPRHPAVWLSRFWTFALTGRPTAAIAMIDDPARRPALPPQLVEMLRLSCTALSTRSPDDVDRAVAANVAASRKGQFGVVNATLTLPQLGASDVAYEINRGYLLREGPMIGSLDRPAGQRAINQQNRRKTMSLWMPAAAPLRADPRFLPLCRAAGLVDYWRQSRSRPDFLPRSVAL